MADGKKRSGPPTDCLSSPNFTKERAVCLIAGIIGVPRYCCVRVWYFRAPGSSGLATRTSRTGSHAQSSGKIFITAKLFGELRECLRGCLWSSLTCYAQLSKTTSAKKNLVLHSWYLKYEYQVLLRWTCLVLQGATFCFTLLVRELSRRWVGIVSHLQ